MKLRIGLTLIAVLACMWPLHVNAQTAPSAAETVENLKLQLIDLNAKEQELNLQRQQLDSDLQPENIERALAGVGSTRPEELREQRRRQLTIEQTKVTTQLNQIAAQRTRLEAQIATAEVDAYHQSAMGNELTAAQDWKIIRWMLLVTVILFCAIGLSLAVFLKFRSTARKTDN